MNSPAGRARAARRGEVNPFDAIATSYDRMRAMPPAALERIADVIIRYTGATMHTRIFEPGVGTGRIAAPFVHRGYNYTGLDSSAPMLRVLRGRPGGSGVARSGRPDGSRGGPAGTSSHAAGGPCPRVPGGERWRVVLGDARALPFADASFDVVLTVHLLYLVDDWPAALAEIRRVLRPGGAYLHCFEHSSPTPAARAVADAWRAALGNQGADASWPTATTDADILVALRADGAATDMESAVAARWTRNRRLAEFLDGYGTRLRPLYPAVPDDMFAAATEDFLASVRRAYPAGAAVGDDVRFEIHATRWGHELP